MKALAGRLRLEVVQGPSGSSDAGFDITARRIVDGQLACVQCKRLAAPLNLGHVGEELAKVALTSMREGTTVLEHRILCAGAVANAVRGALRQTSRKILVECAVEAAQRSAALRELRKLALIQQVDVAAIVSAHVRRLDVISAWSGRELALELEEVWPAIAPIVAQTFAVETLVLEEPRPDFRREAFLESQVAREGFRLELRARPADFPPNLSEADVADPLDVALVAPLAPDGLTETTLTEIVTSVSPGVVNVLVAPGGGGKTVALQMASSASSLRARADPDAPLPIFLPLALYEGDLQALIERTLGLTRGRWSSVAKNILLLCDGLDEIPGGRTQAFLDQLSTIVKSDSVAAVVSLRSSGLKSPSRIRRGGRCFALDPLRTRDIVRLAEQVLEKHQIPLFLSEVRETLERRTFALLTSPFGLATAIAVFRETGVVPRSVAELIDAMVARRLLRNRKEERANLLEFRLRELPDSTILTLASAIAFEIRIVMGRAVLRADEALGVVARVAPDVRGSGAFGVSSLSDVDLAVLARHYELLEPAVGSSVRLPHDLVADKWASGRLAVVWEQHLDLLDEPLGDDCWRFAAPLVAPARFAEFILLIADVDLVLAARCASEVGLPGRNVLEARLLADEANSSLRGGIRRLALSALGTEACIARLRREAHGYDHKQLGVFQAMRGLAALGDQATLRIVLDDLDEWASFPGTVTGGLDRHWAAAPANIALALARSKLDARPAPRHLGCSLQTVSNYGDSTDADRVLAILENTGDRQRFYAAGRCLLSVSPSLGVERLRRIAEDEKDERWLASAELLASDGRKFPIQRVIDLYLKEIEEFKPASAPEVRLLLRAELPADAESRMRARYDSASFVGRTALWQVAVEQRMRAFDDVALQILTAKEGGEELGSAARFVGARDFDLATEALLAERCATWARTLPLPARQWDVHRLLEFLSSRRQYAQVAEILSGHVATLMPRYLETLRMHGEPKTPETGDELQDRYEREFALVGLLEIAAPIADLLPEATAKALLGIQLCHVGDDVREAAQTIMCRLKPEEVDQELQDIADPFARAFSLAVASRMGPTPGRVAMLVGVLGELFGAGVPAEQLAESIEHLWCPSVRDAIVSLVEQAVWRGDVGSQLHQPMINAVAGHIELTAVDAQLRPALARAVSRESRDVLQHWIDVALLGRRR